MNKSISKSLLMALLSVFLFQACTYDNEEDLYPEEPECDLSNVTYSGTVAPILADNCNGCHSSGSPSAGVITDNYDDLKVIVDNGRFWGAINHDQGYSAMPQNLPKLPDCELSQIRTWIDAGALDN